jgi:hypothetical protein
MPSQPEQYGSTVHLFIGTGRSPCKITSRPFAFDNNSIVIHRDLDSLFLFKSVSFFLSSCRSSLAHNFGSVPSFVPLVFLHTVILTQVWKVHVRRYLLMYYTPEILLNHVFEDLRKPKAPNRHAHVATKHPTQHHRHFILDEKSTTNSSRLWYPQLWRKLRVNNFSMQLK